MTLSKKSRRFWDFDSKKKRPPKVLPTSEYMYKEGILEMLVLKKGVASLDSRVSFKNGQNFEV